MIYAEAVELQDIRVDTKVSIGTKSPIQRITLIKSRYVSKPQRRQKFTVDLIPYVVPNGEECLLNSINNITKIEVFFAETNRYGYSHMRFRIHNNNISLFTLMYMDRYSTLWKRCNYSDEKTLKNILEYMICGNRSVQIICGYYNLQEYIDQY